MLRDDFEPALFYIIPGAKRDAARTGGSGGNQHPPSVVTVRPQTG